jgi:integrase
VSIRLLPDGRYEWRWRVDGRQVKKKFATKRDAALHDAQVRADVARGTHVDASNKTTVAEYARAWSQARHLRSRESHESFLHRDVEGTPLGARPLVQVRPSEIQAWVTHRAGPLAPSTLRVRLGLLRSVFAAAVRDGVIHRNPVLPGTQLSLPKLDRPPFTPLTVAQVRAWADAAHPRVRAMILTQSALGLRISELRALRVTDIEWPVRKVHIGEQLDTTGRHRVPLKTARSRRTVLLPAPIAALLSEHIRRFPPGADGLIFTSTRGRAWTVGSLRTSYGKAAVAAGLPEGTASHALRHHFVSVLLAAGHGSHEVAEQIGDTAAMVDKVYGHVMPDREDTMRQTVEAAWAGFDVSAGRAAR